ncbi:hypothetical protein EYR36_006380 [Pleurotus pulmonarius]|nr:hypothetical protein EYR36_006380 [Pleurotus pulmonarius]KAF4601078.1 hypothetical protein EYR38_005728 [Pleurotus pulmonarius]
MNSVELLDKEITKCLEKARSLRELRNSQYSATSRLPLEVLALIFEALAFTKDPKLSGRELRGPTNLTGDYHPCHNVSHVCRSWRTLVLNMSAIWGILYGECSKKWMDSMTAARIKPHSPIFLRAPRSSLSSRAGRQTHSLTFDAARFEDLEVEVANVEIATVLHRLFRAPITLSALTSLSLSWATHSSGRWNGFPWRAHAPRLEVMDLRDVSLHFLGGSFPALQSFTMVLKSSCHHVTIVELLQMLKAMPRLRFLECARMFAEIEHDPIPPDLQVELPYLEHVIIQQLSWRDLCVFDHITSPPLKSFALEMHSWSCMTDAVPDLTLVHKFLPPPSPSADSWKILLQKTSHIFRDDQFTLKMAIVPGAPPATPDFRFDFLCDFVDMEKDKEWHVKRDICAALPSMPDTLAVVFHARNYRYIPSSLLPKSFLVDMAPMEEVHFNDLTLLLEALMPGHRLDAEPSTERAFSRALPKPAKPAAKKTAPRRGKRTAKQAHKLPSPPRIYLPNLRRAVLVQEPVQIAEEQRNLILLRLARVFGARHDVGLPILTLKIGGDIELTDDEKNVLGDGVTCLVQVLSEGVSYSRPCSTRQV